MLLHFAGSLAALKLPFSQMKIPLEGIALYFMFPLCHFAQSTNTTRFSNRATSPGGFKESCIPFSRAYLYFVRGNLVFMRFCSVTGCSTLGFCCMTVQRYTPSCTGQTEILSEAAAISARAHAYAQTNPSSYICLCIQLTGSS